MFGIARAEAINKKARQGGGRIAIAAQVRQIETERKIAKLAGQTGQIRDCRAHFGQGSDLAGPFPHGCRAQFRIRNDARQEGVAGGERVMAQVLALVPAAGLDAVLVAVSLALEGAPPSGRVSVEHVVNVLARLKESPPPACAATTLQAKTPPRADTARYDRLREGAAAQPEAGEVGHA